MRKGATFSSVLKGLFEEDVFESDLEGKMGSCRESRLRGTPSAKSLWRESQHEEGGVSGWVCEVSGRGRLCRPWSSLLLSTPEQHRFELCGSTYTQIFFFQ